MVPRPSAGIPAGSFLVNYLDLPRQELQAMSALQPAIQPRSLASVAAMQERTLNSIHFFNQGAFVPVATTRKGDDKKGTQQLHSDEMGFQYVRRNCPVSNGLQHAV
jgi:hypothetical protein